MFRRVLAILSLLFIFHPAWSYSSELSDDQVFRMGNGAEPKLLDPSKATGTPESRILYNLFEGLTSVNPVNLDPIPGVAESWTVSEDGLVYTFKIRANAKWSDGKELNAHDFIRSWQRTLSPELGSEYAYQLYAIKNAKDINLGKIKDPNQLGVTAPDAHTLVITLEHPTPYFIRLTGFYSLFPTPAHVIEKFPEQAWTKEGRMVSNGPFVLKEWKINRHVKLIPNPHYWDYQSIKLKEAVILPIEQVDTEEKTFWAGDLHITNDVPSLKIPAYQKKIAENPQAYHPYQPAPYLGIYYYRFNTTKPPFNDARVRRAFAISIDRKLLVERVAFGGQRPATHFTPPGIAGYEGPAKLPPTISPEQIAEAKKLLAEAGYPNGKGLPKVEILYNTLENHKRLAIALAQMWKKNLGIEVGLFNQEWKVYLDTQRTLQYTISRAGWIGDYPDPNTFLNMYVTGGSNNQTGWSNKQYDALIAEADKTLDQEKRLNLLLQAENILLDELPVLPIYFYTKPQLLSEKVRMRRPDGTYGPWQANVQNLILLKYYALSK